MTVLSKIYYDGNFQPELIAQEPSQGYPTELNCRKEYDICVHKLTVKFVSIKCERLSVFLQLQFTNTFSAIMVGQMQR